MKKTFLDFYHACMETGKMPGYGLCDRVHKLHRRKIKLFHPTQEDLDNLFKLGKDRIYWGSGLKTSWYFDPAYEINKHKFTPLRQTIVLLCAAINNEL
jgi:hypothetical protein